MADTNYMLTLSERYGLLADEALALAVAWRELIAKSSIDYSFKADQHKRCLLRAAAFSRAAAKARDAEMASIRGVRGV